MNEPKSWRGIVYAAQGHCLIGGKKTHESSRFENQTHAQAWANAVARTNQANGRMIAKAEVLPSQYKPEIFQDDVELLN